MRIRFSILAALSLALAPFGSAYEVPESSAREGAEELLAKRPTTTQLTLQRDLRTKLQDIEKACVEITSGRSPITPEATFWSDLVHMRRELVSYYREDKLTFGQVLEMLQRNDSLLDRFFQLSLAATPQVRSDLLATLLSPKAPSLAEFSAPPQARKVSAQPLPEDPKQTYEIESSVTEDQAAQLYAFYEYIEALTLASHQVRLNDALPADSQWPKADRAALNKSIELGLRKSQEEIRKRYKAKQVEVGCCVLLLETSKYVKTHLPK